MKTTLTLCFFNLLTLLTELQAQPAYQGNLGFGVGEHFYTEEQGGEQTISTLVKGQITYKYVRTSADTAVIRKCVQGTADEELVRFGPSEALKIYWVYGSFLIDVLQQGNETAILMILPQSYYYLKLTRDYPTGNPPADDWYLPDPPEYTALAWKPLALGNLSPTGLNVTDLQNEVNALSHIALNGMDRIDLDFKEGKGTDTTYTFGADGIMKDGNPFGKLLYFRKQLLESDFFAQRAAMSDTELKTMSLGSVTETGTLNAEALAFLNSFHDTAKAQALRARIEQLFKPE